MAKYINLEETIIAFGFTWDDIAPTRDEFVNFLKTCPAADVLPKEDVRQIICGICNELHSEEPCEPADCAWMERLDNSIREVCSGNNE